VLELTTEVIAARQKSQGRLIRGFLGHGSPQLHSA
jgi:hypothetical protein